MQRCTLYMYMAPTGFGCGPGFWSQRAWLAFFVFMLWSWSLGGSRQLWCPPWRPLLVAHELLCPANHPAAAALAKASRSTVGHKPLT